MKILKIAVGNDRRFYYTVGEDDVTEIKFTTDTIDFYRVMKGDFVYADVFITCEVIYTKK